MSLTPNSAVLPSSFVANSPAMLDVLARIDMYARARTPLLIVGETGTGKTTVAELVHKLSGRPGSLTARTAGEFDGHLERSQIFGHERGAFTDAVERQIGVLEEAGEGTLLLDDFHHLRRGTQALLLRALDRRTFRRLGGREDIPLRGRILVGLTESPDTMVERGALLPELRFRLGYSVIHLPRLEERREEIGALAHAFLVRCPAEVGLMGPDRLAPSVIAVLELAAWPGNLRQLEMVIRDAYLRGRESAALKVEHLPDSLSLKMQFHRRGAGGDNAQAVQRALDATEGRVRDAAKLLKISKSALYSYLAQHSLDLEDRRAARYAGSIGSRRAT